MGWEKYGMFGQGPLSKVWIVSVAGAIAYFAAVSSATSADVAPAAPVPYVQPSAPIPFDPGTSFEVRFGEYVHGVGSVERYTPDVSGSFLTPRLNFWGITGLWADFVPRLQFGGNYNLVGRTSFAYADMAWTFPIGRWLFFEPFFGGAIHDGSLYGTPTLSGLGCPELFHVGGTFGVPVVPHWTVMGTFEHLSNGKRAFGVDCGTNQIGGGNEGLNNYGLRIGYDF